MVVFKNYKNEIKSKIFYCVGVSGDPERGATAATLSTRRKAKRRLVDSKERNKENLSPINQSKVYFYYHFLYITSNHYRNCIIPGRHCGCKGASDTSIEWFMLPWGKQPHCNPSTSPYEPVWTNQPTSGIMYMTVSGSGWDIMKWNRNVCIGYLILSPTATTLHVGIQGLHWICAKLFWNGEKNKLLVLCI